MVWTAQVSGRRDTTYSESDCVTYTPAHLYLWCGLEGHVFQECVLVRDDDHTDDSGEGTGDDTKVGLEMTHSRLN